MRRVLLVACLWPRAKQTRRPPLLRPGDHTQQDHSTLYMTVCVSQWRSMRLSYVFATTTCCPSFLRRRSRPRCRRTLRSCYYQYYYSTKLKFRYSILISARWTSIFKFNFIYRLKRHLSRHHHLNFLNFRWNVCEEPLMCMFIVIVIIVWTLMNIFVTYATSLTF